jgi:hypothetical protein
VLWDGLAPGRRAYLALAPLVLAVACASSPPPRYVLEKDLGAYAYRRYQKVLDVEFVVPNNRAVGHTATYLKRGGQDVAVVTAFVTVYEQARSLAAEVKEQLAELASYDVSVADVEGEWMWRLSGPDGQWLVWVSNKHVVKLGAQGDAPIPESVVEAYADRYPSDLEETGRADEDAPSAGPSQRQAKEEEALRMPLHLRETEGRDDGGDEEKENRR